MVETFPADRARELAAEKRLLLKAEANIEAGWSRIRNQQDLLSSLQAAGNNAREAERLEQLMKETLIEWERHRVLIEQRIAYLEHGAFLQGRR
jgi:hypothetical protein